MDVTEASALEVTKLTRCFGGRNVVDGVSFAVRPGRITCLLGPSGCGKSTTLRMIAGVELSDSGEVRINGTLVVGPGVMVPPERRSVGLMFQDFALFPHLDVAGNIAFGLTGTRAEKSARVEELLRRVSLEGFGAKFPHELSGGEQQRVALVRALAPRPRIMLMDEPFSGLDHRLRDGIRDSTLDLLKEEGTAVVLVTHEPEEAMRMADQIALMRAGRIVQIGPPAAIYGRPADGSAAAFFSDLNIVRGQVFSGRVATAFGHFDAPTGAGEGEWAEVLIRPQHLRIEFDRNGRGPIPTDDFGTAVRARVARARYLGRESLVEFHTDGGDIPMRATLPGLFLPQQGTPFWLLIPRARSFVFPAGAGRGHDGTLNDFP